MRIVIVSLKAIAGKESAALDFLQGHAGRSKLFEAGCFDFMIARDPENPETFFAIETYADAESHAAHRDTDHFKRFVDECLPMMQDAPDGTKFFSRQVLDQVG